MKLNKCRIQNYRCITDSGWVDFDDIAVIVGRNESGKTSFLKALWRLKPYRNIGYNIDREWPSGRRKEKSLEKVVVEAVFSFSPEEQADIAAIHESAKGIEAVEIGRNYAGRYSHQFTPQNPSTEHTVEWVVDLLQKRLEAPSETFSDHFRAQYAAAFSILLEDVRNDGGSERAVEVLSEIKGKLSSFRAQSNPPQQQDNNAIGQLNERIDEVVAEIQATPLLRVVDYVHQQPSSIWTITERLWGRRN